MTVAQIISFRPILHVKIQNFDANGKARAP